MSVIDLDLAMKHLLAEPEDQGLIEIQLEAAEETAQQYLQRRFYATTAEVASAKAGAIQRVRDARAAYQAAISEAETLDFRDRLRVCEQARQLMADSFEEIDMDVFSIVVNKAIIAACLLTLGHLFANREEVVVGAVVSELPLASRHLLNPYRTRMGV